MLCIISVTPASGAVQIGERWESAWELNPSIGFQELLKMSLECVKFLAENDLPENFQMQMSSTAYREWLNEDNDIYDEVFRDE